MKQTLTGLTYRIIMIYGLLLIILNILLIIFLPMITVTADFGTCGRALRSETEYTADAGDMGIVPLDLIGDSWK